MTLPNRPIATCVVSEVLKPAILPVLDEDVVERQEELAVTGGQ
jgi:hypothetical protein